MLADSSPEAQLETQKHLHLLDGSALTLGANDLSQCINDIKNQIKSNESESAEEMIVILEEAFDQTKTTLIKIIETKNTENV